MKPEEKEYYDLCIKFLMGNTLPEEDELLHRWKKAALENETYFNATRDTWYVTSQIKQPGLFDENKALNLLHQKISEASPAEEGREARKTINFRKYLKVAATWLIIFSLGGFASSLLTRKGAFQQPQFIKVVAPKGSRSVAYLPDGSTVWLNAGSEISYRIGSGKNREVTLIGEAFFKVKSNSAHPFIVSANGIAIKALGTSFNVKAYPEEKKVTTTLVEGKVNIEKPGSNGSKPIVIAMRPNQKVVVFNDSSMYLAEKSKLTNNKTMQKENSVALDEAESIPAIKAQDINTDLYTSWKDNRWIIDGEEFGNLAVLLERRYNVDILFWSNELKTYRFSGTITNETIEQALSLMRYTLPFSYVIEKNKIVLKVDPILMKSYNSAYEKK